MMKNITVIGTGYVGLVTGVCLADFGFNIICVDNNAEKINSLKNGILPIYEPGLEDILKKNYDGGRLQFTTDVKKGVEDSEVIFIAVGTPAEQDGSADLQYVKAVARDIAKYMNSYKVIVIKSTVPIGTGKKIQNIINKNLLKPYPFDIVSNPEFLREGEAIHDFMHPDRIIIGTESSRAQEIMANIYQNTLSSPQTPVLFTDIETAETIKYAANAFLALKVSFINEMAALCEKVGADVNDLSQGIGMDRRIGQKYLNPGPGYGGSCLPKDTRALVKISEAHGLPMPLIATAIKINEEQKIRVVKKIEHFLGDLRNKTIGILGLAFKPGTDDMREAPALTIIPELCKKGALIKAYDPQAMKEARWRLVNISNIIYCEDEYQVAANADALVILTEWDQFKNLNFNKITAVIKTPRLFDFRNIYEPSILKAQGFEYYSLGRKCAP